jgi:hypothetical protein
MRMRRLAFTLLLAACARQTDRASRDTTSRPDTAHAAATPTRDTTRDTTLDRIVAGIRQGATDSAVRALAGAPDSMSAAEFSEMIGDTVQSWHYAGLVVDFVDHRADGVLCRRDACATGKGVRVGDPEGAVTRAYGAGERTRGDDGESLVYRDENNCGMSFDLAGGRVRAVRVWCDHS